jgi:hypothetical protein
MSDSYFGDVIVAAVQRDGRVLRRDERAWTTSRAFCRKFEI